MSLVIALADAVDNANGHECDVSYDGEIWHCKKLGLRGREVVNLATKETYLLTLTMSGFNLERVNKYAVW